MAIVKIWIQLENKKWDMMPHNIDRMTGSTAQQILTSKGVTLPATNGGKYAVTRTTSTGVVKSTLMNAPIMDSDGPADALIYRRYKAPVLADQSDAWTVPDDRKINPWDMNEA